MSRIHLAAAAALALGATSTISSPAVAQFPTRPPAAGPVKPAQFPPFQESLLPNGMRLVLVESHKQPVLSLSLSFPAGSSYDPAGKTGVANLTAQLLTKGAGTRSAEEIAATIEGVGGSLAAGAGPDFVTLRADALAANAELAFSLLADAAARPTFPEKELELARTQTLSSLQLEASQPASLASRFFSSTLYGQHPYGRYPTPASVRSISRADLVAYHAARMRPGGALLVIAGDIDLATAKRLATSAFAGWTGAAPAPVTFAAVPTRATTGILLVHRPGSVQSNIIAGNTTYTPGDSRFYAATVANKVLGGGADSRLFMTLREQKGWTYGAYSSLNRPKGVGAFIATAEVRTEVTDSSVNEILRQLRMLRTTLVPAAELEAAKGALVGSFPLTIETAEQVAGAVTRAKLLGLPADYLQTYRPRLAAVTPASLRTAVATTIRPSAMTIVVVGDGMKLYDKLAAIAPVKIVSADGTPLTARDLAPSTAKLAIDESRLVARRDSFVVMVQGQPFGAQVVALSKTATGYSYTDNTSLGPIGAQSSEITFASGTLAPMMLKQTGKVQGQDVGAAVTYAGGRAKGTASVPGATGATTTTVDAAITAGTFDDNMLPALIPGMAWAPAAKLTVNLFSTGKNAAVPVTLAAGAVEKVTVPAGTFDAYRVDVTGGQQPLTVWVTSAAPHRLVKMALVGAPLEFLLAK